VNIEHFLDIFFQRNIFIIEVLFGLVLLGVIFLTIKSFMRPEGTDGELNLSGLEDGLKKIIENYSGNSLNNTKAESAIEGDAIMEEMATQIERLKLQLMQKTEEVEQLKAGGAVSTSVSSAVETSAKSSSSSSGGAPAELEEKVRELEARLSEYSIIEDDIADLSFYKEETVRLQSEIDKLKAKLAEYEAGGPPPRFMAPPPPSATPPPSKSAESEAPIVKPNVVPVTPSSPQNTPTTSTATSAIPVEAIVPEQQPAASISIDDDIMAEFERAVAEQKALSSAQKVATEIAPAAAPEVAPAAVSTVSNVENNIANLNTVKKEEIAETVSKTKEGEISVATDATDSTEEASISGINLDKMLSEVGGLPESTETEIANALEQELDTEKLLKEATGMEKIDSEAIADFDNILKKEGA